MGNQQTTTANIFVRDNTLDDVFTNYLMDKSFSSTNWIEYIVSVSDKSDGDDPSTNNELDSSIEYEMSSTYSLLTNADGTIEKSTDDYISLVESVQSDLIHFHDTDGFNIQIVLTEQCAPFIVIMSEFMNSDITTDPYLTPANVEIVVVDWKRNEQKFFDALIKLTRVCNDHNIGLVVREFNAFISIGDGSKSCVDVGVCQHMSEYLYKIVNYTKPFLNKVSEDLKSGLISDAVSDYCRLS
jgi:hypothetical protein